MAPIPMPLRNISIVISRSMPVKLGGIRVVCGGTEMTECLNIPKASRKKEMDSGNAHCTVLTMPCTKP